MPDRPHEPVLGDPQLRGFYGRLRGKVAFIDESYRAPKADRPGFYSITGSLIDRDAMIETRRKLLTVTGGKTWHTTEALVHTPAVIGRMTQAIAVNVDSSTLVVSTPWTDGSAGQHRSTALRTLVAGLARQGASAIVLDSSREATESRDKAVIHAMRSSGEIPRNLAAVHSSDDVEALLWVPDTIGWTFNRLVTMNQAEWSKDLVDVVAVKDAERDGWVDLTTIQDAAAEREAHAELLAQVQKIRAGVAPSGERQTTPLPAILRRQARAQRYKGPEL